MVSPLGRARAASPFATVVFNAGLAYRLFIQCQSMNIILTSKTKILLRSEGASSHKVECGQSQLFADFLTE